ncbi:MAG: hypothetical protein U0768_06595 [Anaerolineae bacterium]
MKAPTPRAAALGTAAGAAWFLVAFLAAAWLAPLTPLRMGMAALATSLWLLAAVGPLLYFAGALALPSYTDWAGVGIVAAAGVALDVVFSRVAASGDGAALAPALASLGLLLAAALVGVIIARFAILDVDLLLLVFVLYIIIDAYSVFLGPTQAIIARGGAALNLLTVRFPLLTTTRIVPSIGATDFLVWAAGLQAAYRFRFPYTASFAALALGLAASALISAVTSRPVPALPLMMVFYLILNRRAFRWRQPGLWALAAGLLALVVGVGVLTRWWLLR